MKNRKISNSTKYAQSKLEDVLITDFGIFIIVFIKVMENDK